MRLWKYFVWATLCGAAVAWPQEELSIEGRVVNALSGEAVRNVSVTLAAARGGQEPRTAQTDDNGRFAFRGLSRGGYTLSAERNGYQRQAYGARRNPASGTVLGLSPGQELRDLVFRLAPDGVISGRVMDEQGEPASGVGVTAFRKIHTGGQAQWAAASAAATNDRGEFRIAGLRAGSYAVCANPIDSGFGLTASEEEALPANPETARVSTCYGNSTDLAAAVRADVRPGEDRRGTDIQLARAPTVRIRGKVTGAREGKALIAMLLRKTRAGQNPAGVALVSERDGSFEVRNVTPGSYLLIIRAAMEFPGLAAAPAPVEVAGRHVDGIEIAGGGAGTLRGRFRMSPGKPEAGGNPSVALDWPEFPLRGMARTEADGGGAFTIHNVFPGRYRLSIENLPAGAYVQSVRLNGREIDEASAEIGGSGELEIAVSRTGAAVEGVVHAPDGKSLPGALVALIPDSGREPFYRIAAADHDGAFEIRGVPPGKYKALAWDDIEPEAYRDREFVKPFEERAQSLSLEENGHSTLKLTAILSASR